MSTLEHLPKWRKTAPKTGYYRIALNIHEATDMLKKVEPVPSAATLLILEMMEKTKDKRPVKYVEVLDTGEVSTVDGMKIPETTSVATWYWGPIEDPGAPPLMEIPDGVEAEV